MKDEVDDLAAPLCRAFSLAYDNDDIRATAKASGYEATAIIIRQQLALEVARRVTARG